MLKHIISIFIWTAIGLYLLLVILLHIPYIQKNLGSQVASAISHKLDAKVSIGRVDFGFLNRTYPANGGNSINNVGTDIQLAFFPIP